MKLQREQASNSLQVKQLLKPLCCLLVDLLQVLTQLFFLNVHKLSFPFYTQHYLKL